MRGKPNGKTAVTTKARYGDDFYVRIGRMGGSAPHSKPRGFAANPSLAREAGIKGGKLRKGWTKYK